MKSLFFLLLFSSSAFAKFIADGCPMESVRTQGPQGFYCAPLYGLFPQPQTDCIVCLQMQLQRQQQMTAFNPWLMQMPLPMMPPQTPWWAQQGRMMYPNFQAPGAWQYPGMNPQPYPGNAPVFAAKPNVYVKNTNKTKASFSMKFDLKESKSTFLATTPWLENNQWIGEIQGEEFRVDKVKYDYLFYDARMPHESMQFEAGWCINRADLVRSMAGELIQLGFSPLAMSDFYEHWDQKNPDEPVFCVYPQYNKELDAALPIQVKPAVPFVRVLFVLVPHRPDEKTQPVFPPLPRQSHFDLRTKNIEGELQFLEWGVAFLDHRLIK